MVASSTQTTVSLPGRLTCLWHANTVEQMSVVDVGDGTARSTRVMASDQSSSGSDPGDSESDVSATDPRQCQVAGGDNRAPEPAAAPHTPPVSSPGSMFDFDELEARSPVESDVSMGHIRLLSYNGHIDDTSIPDHVEEEVPVIDDPMFVEIDENAPESEEDPIDTEYFEHLSRCASDRGNKRIGSEYHKRWLHSRSFIQQGMAKQGTVKRRVRHLEASQNDPAMESTVVLPRADEPGEGETPRKRKTRTRSLMTLPTSPARKIGSQRMKMARGITVDSGAADNVLPRRILRKWMRVRQSQASRNGVHYVAANGSRIRNEGEVDFKFETKNGDKHSWTFQVAEVNKVLASVSALVDSGHTVTFDKDPATGVDLSRIIHKKTGRSVPMRRERNVWTIDTFVNDDAGFSRQE